MAGSSKSREELVGFLDRKVFDPILHAKEDRFSGEPRKKFESLRRSTESEKKRFHDDYASAGDVRSAYLSDLSSSTGERKSKDAHELDLLALPDVKGEFLKLCDELGVGPRG